MSGIKTKVRCPTPNCDHEIVYFRPREQIVGQHMNDRPPLVIVVTCEKCKKAHQF